MVHFDTKRLPLLKGESPKKTMSICSLESMIFQENCLLRFCRIKLNTPVRNFFLKLSMNAAYTIEQVYSDNGLEYRGIEQNHAFMKLCKENNIEVKQPQTNGKAERVIRTIMEMWHKKTEFKNRQHRKLELIRFVNYYNTVKPHAGINNLTQMEKLIEYFYPTEL